ncbi:MAG: TetR/AcrR family transcriptional regulator [Lapillicoccus sp.]
MDKRAAAAAATGERILDAATVLFARLPYAQLTLAAVAHAAGVTPQTVIRRFGDKEGLVAACTAQVMPRILAQRDAAPAGDLPGAVDNLVAHYEEAGTIALRLLAEESTSPTLGELAAQGRAYHRAWCERVFAPALQPLDGVLRTRRLAQLVAVCDVQTWALLRRDAGLSRDEVTVALTELLTPLLDPRRSRRLP